MGYKMDNNINCGSAVFDEWFLPVTSDEGFYKTLGRDLYAPLTQSIHHDDIQRFKEAVLNLKREQLPYIYTSVRLEKQDGSTFWASVKLSSVAKESPTEGKLYRFEFLELDPRNDDRRFQQLNDEYELLLGINDCIILTYTISEDALTIYRQCSNQHMPLFSGTLSEWQARIESGLDPSSGNEFQHLCAALSQGKASFRYSIKTSAILDTVKPELFDFRCQSIHHTSSGEFRILGLITPAAGLQDADNSINYVMDAGLPVLNKKSIISYAKNSMAAAVSRIYLVIIDLDDFKEINDNYGHLFGDEVLANTVEILKNSIGELGMVGRIGGDELMVVLSHVDNLTELRTLLRTIRVRVELSYKDKLKDHLVTCSMGAAAYPDQGASYDEVFKAADRMLYLAKEKGKNRYIMFTPGLHDILENRTPSQSTSARKLSELRNDKTGVILHMINLFAEQRVVNYETMLNEVGYSFDLDAIFIIYGGANSFVSWDKENLSLTVAEDPVLTRPDENFKSSFDKNGVFHASNIFNLQSISPDISAVLLKMDIMSSFFYKFSQQSENFNYVMFARKKRRQQWAEYEKVLLAVVGRALEFFIGNR
ncbi:MAG: sensor domain-containing diguanylate cyclase [Lachnospiraceae bacterium]|nr:sensor domain-containing diguanylate cyclase [Lachnospiraceae bacterium]